jgi:CRISP-associated protein Cas1
MQIVLNKFGSSLSLKDGLFQVKTEEEQHCFAVSKVKCIVAGKGVRLSSDALMLAIENEIDVMLVSRSGQPVGKIWSNKYGSISVIRKQQLLFSQSESARYWVADLIGTKIKNQTALLFTLCGFDLSQQDKVNEVVQKIEQVHARFEVGKMSNNEDCYKRLRGIEGICSKYYFEALNLFLPHQFCFNERSQHPASDMFNCMLNYAYGMLYGKVETALIRAGLDPYIGIMHRDDYNKPVLNYDFIELYRMWADYVVVYLCVQQVMFIEFFDKEQGGLYLNENGKRILITAMNDYLAEVVDIKSLSRSRENHIFMHAQDFSQKMKKF